MAKIKITNEEEIQELENKVSDQAEPEYLDDTQKEEQGFKPREICIDEKDKTLEKIYEDEGLQLIQRPPRMSKKTIIIGTVIAFMIGLIIGVFGTILFLKFF